MASSTPAPAKSILERFEGRGKQVLKQGDIENNSIHNAPNSRCLAHGSTRNIPVIVKFWDR